MLQNTLIKVLKIVFYINLLVVFLLKKIKSESIIMGMTLIDKSKSVKFSEDKIQ